MSLIELIGNVRVERKLNQLAPKLRRKVIRQATRAAAKVVLADARRYAPYETGRLERSLTVRTAKGKSGRRLPRGVQGHGVVTTSSSSLFAGETFYAGFIELGTRYIEAREFMREAAVTQRPAARRVFYDHLRRGLLEATK